VAGGGVMKKTFMTPAPFFLRLFAYLLNFYLAVYTLPTHAELLNKSEPRQSQLPQKKQSAQWHVPTNLYLESDVPLALRSKYKPYFDMVWNKAIKNELPPDELNEFRISKKNIALGLADLDGDGVKDILFSLVENDYSCGKFGKDCGLEILLIQPGGDMRRIVSCMSIFWENPIYVLPRKTSGLKELFVNEKFILKFDGKQYCDQ
jgi:hypothetical protein